MACALSSDTRSAPSGITSTSAGPAPLCFVLQPALREWRVADRLLPLERDEHHPVSNLVRPIPRAVLGDEDLVPIFRREHPAGVEPHADRGDVRAERVRRRDELRTRAFFSVLRIREVAAVAVRISKVQPRLRRVVQFVGRYVAAERIATVFGEPHFFRRRVPVETNRVPHAARKHLRARSVRVHPGDRCELRIARLADVARRPDRHIQLSVGPERDELPAVVPLGRKRS